MKKFIIIFSTLLILFVVGYFYFNYYFVVGRGVKAGELNYMVEKGYVFKTFEGKLIQSGFRTTSKVNNGGTAVQSNDFEFSVQDEEIANTLMLGSGKNMQLHYKEYRKALPWRGFSNFVVDKIVTIDQTQVPQ